LKKRSRATGPESSGGKSRVRVTYGEVLPGSTVIELVASAHRDGVDLLYWDGKESVIVPQIEHDGVIYQAPDLHPTIRQAIWFPGGAADYGTTGALFQGVAGLFPQYLGFSEDSAALSTIWILSSWLPEHFPAPPTLCIGGPNMGQAMKLLRLFAPLCRRSLIVAELSRQLPIFLRPTLLLNDPRLTVKVLASWRASNYHGVYATGSGGVLRDLACSKAVFSEMGDAEGWGDEAMRLTLLPTAREFPPLTHQDQVQIAAEFQPQLLMYRLRHLRPVPQSGSRRPSSAGFELSQRLLVCVQEEPEIVQTVAPLLESHEQELLRRRSLDPHVAIVEALWGPAHGVRKLSPSEVTKRVNAILRARGEVYEYNFWEIGWKLNNLLLCRHRHGNGRALHFSRESRQRVHELARQFGLKLPSIEGCPDCADVQQAEE
jgi:hypothetical protein